MVICGRKVGQTFMMSKDFPMDFNGAPLTSWGQRVEELGRGLRAHSFRPRLWPSRARECRLHNLDKEDKQLAISRLYKTPISYIYLKIVLHIDSFP